MIIRDEMRVERTNIIFGLRGNNTDLQTVRIKLGRLEGEAGRAVLPAVGRAWSRLAGFVPGSSAQGAKARDRSCSGLAFRHSTAIPGGGWGVAACAALKAPPRNHGDIFLRVVHGFTEVVALRTLFCTVPQYFKMAI